MLRRLFIVFICLYSIFGLTQHEIADIDTTLDYQERFYKEGNLDCPNHVSRLNRLFYYSKEDTLWILNRHVIRVGYKVFGQADPSKVTLYEETKRDTSSLPFCYAEFIYDDDATTAKYVDYKSKCDLGKFDSTGYLDFKKLKIQELFSKDTIQPDSARQGKWVRYFTKKKYEVSGKDKYDYYVLIEFKGQGYPKKAYKFSKEGRLVRTFDDRPNWEGSEFDGERKVDYNKKGEIVEIIYDPYDKGGVASNIYLEYKSGILRSYYNWLDKKYAFIYKKYNKEGKLIMEEYRNRKSYKTVKKKHYYDKQNRLDKTLTITATVYGNKEKEWTYHLISN